jgi:hypothetical protein
MGAPRHCRFRLEREGEGLLSQRCDWIRRAGVDRVVIDAVIDAVIDVNSV